MNDFQLNWAREEIYDWAAFRLIAIIGITGGGSIAAAAFGGPRALQVLLAVAGVFALVVLGIAWVRLRALRARRDGATLLGVEPTWYPPVPPRVTGCSMCKHLQDERAGFLHEIEGLRLELAALRVASRSDEGAPLAG
ncbi:hypothetical protein WMF20_35485 [Sorangium sp. So ce834]|uniref:hypothetical protein n=1 Tax=Sorangium sp. So ce834 TaxID=3133321 RepID=UPI003F607C8E